MTADTKVYQGGKFANLMNTAGKMPRYCGWNSHPPLVMALIFSPEGTADWVVTTGAWSLFALIMASFLIAFVFIKHCSPR